MTSTSFLWRLLVVIGFAISVGDLSAAEKKVALLVGVNDYDKRGLSSLNYAERDMTELATVLKGLGFDVKTMLGSLKENDPLRSSKKNIDTQLNTFLLKDRNKRDIVLMAFSGHGLQKERVVEKKTANGNVFYDVVRNAAGQTEEDAYYCPVDCLKTEVGTLVSLTGIMEKFGEKGGINFMLVDACRDDPSKSTKSISGNELNGRLPANTGVLFSCSAGQQALETGSIGGGHGIFMHHVIEGFKGEAMDPRGNINWLFLTDYLQHHVNAKAIELFPERVQRDKPLQTPHGFNNFTASPILASISKPKVITAPVVPQQTPKPIPQTMPQQTSPQKVANSASPTNSAPVVNNTFEGTKAGDLKVFTDMKINFRWCPPGNFTMGSPASEEGRLSFENQVNVTLTKGFWLQETEVTQSQWEQIMGTTPWSGQTVIKTGKNFPATFVSWDDATAYCEKLTQLERQAGRIKSTQECRLPTEAEWEYACRAGTKTAYSFGDDASILKDYAWFKNNTIDIDEKYPHEVGMKRANPWGFKDMHGNVGEWCSDWFGRELIGGRDPQGRVRGISRSLRGGSWDDYPGFNRSASRHLQNHISKNDGIGFRLLLE